MNKEYVKRELDYVTALHGEKSFKIKIVQDCSGGRSTKWLSVTREFIEKLTEILQQV